MRSVRQSVVDPGSKRKIHRRQTSTDEGGKTCQSTKPAKRSANADSGKHGANTDSVVSCACCNGTGRIALLEAAKFTALQEIMYRLILSRRMNGPLLIEEIYGHRRDGGPDWADGVVHVNICRMNDKLARFGKKIVSVSAKAKAYYKVSDVV